ncbi:MAG: polysaccharide deacetylase family protein [Deltaproteobacteria bacterium]|nr:polysaccharide deacetylase family protein [Deltaproteobacteria bacterium]
MVKRPSLGFGRALCALSLAAACSTASRDAASVTAEPAPIAAARYTVDLGRTPLMGQGHGVLLIGYDVEAIGPDETVEFLRKSVALHRELGAPATYFSTGLTLETVAGEFRALAADPLFDVETHTYTHERLKPLFEERPEGTRFLAASSPDALAASVARSIAASAEVLGQPSIGMTAPFGAYRGLVDRPDLLALLEAAGVRFVRAYSRNERDWQPVPFDVQPFWYALQGHPRILEIPVQGWQDVLWRETHGWDDLAGYRDLLDDALDTVAARNLVWSYCAHDWGSLRGDPDLSLIRHLLVEARRRGIVLATHRGFYEAALASSPPA